MARDLRHFIEELTAARKSDLLRVDGEVDPKFETCAIVAKLEERHRSPMLYFSNVRGSSYPLVSNVCGSNGRLALALGCSLRELSDRWAAAVEHPHKPVIVESAPVQDKVYTGDDVDLRRLPAMVYHEADAESPYITAAIVCAKDPETGHTNLSFHRLMILDEKRTGIFIEKGKHLDAICKKYAKRNEAMPLGVFIGSHPAWSLGALYSGSLDVEEYDIIGGLLGEPLELVRGKTQDVLVPAHAEIVLEGFVTPGELAEEGPFGEFTGYGTGKTMSPVFHVTAMTERDGAIFQDVVSGHMEHLVLPMLAIEHRAKADAMAASANVTQVALPAAFTVVIAMNKTSDDEPRKVIEHILNGDIYRKHVIVVDAEIDVHDLREVLGAVAMHSQADLDVHVFEQLLGTPLDPSCAKADGRVAKMGIDATRRLDGARGVTKNTVPKEVWDRIDIDALMGRK